jgi:hypothetical protein
MATLNFVLKRKLMNNEYYIFLRVSHFNQSSKYLSLRIKTKQREWNKEKQRCSSFLSTKILPDCSLTKTGYFHRAGCGKQIRHDFRLLSSLDHPLLTHLFKKLPAH